ncbi:hypothetical protein B4U80_08080 [Leptotrombidium deliense]|uniref:Uncharacterized protein n=1 Tax=Leptotrombidium deliense TaxID=299467 RepID=A0A443SIX7_9ACAR|nr:hypothetical protein B4U80_08080 [Leptotrombidium deliense]
MRNVNPWISVLGFLGLITAVSAIHCWDCNSFINAGCGDPFRNSSFAIKDCNHRDVHKLSVYGEAKFCRKIVQKVDKHLRVVRDCGWLDEDISIKSHLGPGECVKRSGTFSVLVQYCTCNTDKCNPGAYLLPKAYLLVAATLIFTASAAGPVNLVINPGVVIHFLNIMKLTKVKCFSVNDNDRIFRGCGWIEEDADVTSKLGPGECIKRSGTFSISICKNEDGCNGITKDVPSYFTVFTSLIVAVVFISLHN